MKIPANYEQLIKILILGDSNVGKTNFLLRFTENSFLSNYITTIGYDYKSSVVKVDEKRTVKLQIWDTAGQERFLSVTKNLLLRVQGIVLMYDITEPISFENVRKWFNSIRETTGDKIPIVLVGNKCDLKDNRKVSYEQAKEIAETFSVKLFEASAKENVNVKETFVELALEILTNLSKSKVNGKVISLNDGTDTSKKTCC